MYARPVRSFNSSPVVVALVCIISATGILATGCLSRSHVVPTSELQTLAQMDPQTRGQRVRVTQGLETESDPPPAPAVDGSTHVHVVVAAPVHSHPGPAPVHGVSAKSAKEHAAFWIVVAAAVAVSMAATEGARYDGWVALHPMHPVHLYGWDGSYTWMPLAHITPDVAARTRKAIVRDNEGPWQTLGRAPLDRAGWTYSMLVGSSEIPGPEDGAARGFATHIQFGRFLSQDVGLVFDLGLSWGENLYNETVYDSRSSLELQLMPLAAGILHAGGFGQIGIGHRLDDRLYGRDQQGYLYGGGGMLQLELTTRLALTARAGLTMAYGEPISDFTVGVSIY